MIGEQARSQSRLALEQSLSTICLITIRNPGRTPDRKGDWGRKPARKQGLPA
jgi:hypothetical protein